MELEFKWYFSITPLHILWDRWGIVQSSTKGMQLCDLGGLFQLWWFWGAVLQISEIAFCSLEKLCLWIPNSVSINSTQSIELAFICITSKHLFLWRDQDFRNATISLWQEKKSALLKQCLRGWKLTLLRGGVALAAHTELMLFKGVEPCHSFRCDSRKDSRADPHPFEFKDVDKEFR